MWSSVHNAADEGEDADIMKEKPVPLLTCRISPSRAHRALISFAARAMFFLLRSSRLIFAAMKMKTTKIMLLMIIINVDERPCLFDWFVKT